MTLASQEQGDAVFRALAEFRRSALNIGYKRVLLDLTEVSTLSPEAAILLLAELQRCYAYCRGRSRLGGTHPRDHRVAELLTNIGFYEALQVHAPLLPEAYDDRTFVKVASDRVTDSESIDKLLANFDEVLHMSAEDQRNLHGAILECMDNVFEHAYEDPGARPHLIGEWWLVGFSDRRKREATFIFHDQGLGIVETIKTFKSKQWGFRRIPSWTDAAWIRRAVTKKISRHPSRRRGHGLTRLTQFIEGATVPGSIRVIANKGDYMKSTNENAELRQFSEPAPGTIIVFSLSAASEDPHAEHRP